MVNYRMCTKCGTEKEETVERFGKDKKYVDGLRKICRTCYSIQQGEYYKNKRDKILSHKHQYYLEHKEVISEKSLKHYKSNKEKIRIYTKQYREGHRELFTMHRHKRKALVKMVASNFTTDQWEQLKREFNYKCAYCGETEPLAQDHFVPVIKGGEYTRDNIIPSCKFCNGSKSGKDFFKWYPKFEHYSKEREIFILDSLKYKDHKQQLTLAL